jgi:stress response protein YsnF
VSRSSQTPCRLGTHNSAVRYSAKLMIVPVLEEEVVVLQKQLVLKEELHVQGQVKTEAVEVPVS